MILKRLISFGGKTAKNKTAYKEYKAIINQWSKRINETACTKIDIDPVPRKIAQANGFSKETLETLQTTEFIEKFHAFLAKKGYKAPKSLFFYEHMIPRQSGVAGVTLNKHVGYSPRGIKTLDLRIPIHEEGHFLHGFTPFITNLKLGRDNYKFLIGEKLKKIPFLKNYFKNHQLCHLTKKEQEILMADYARAYKEGFFKHNPIGEVAKEQMALLKGTSKEGQARRYYNQTCRDFRKHPEKYYMPNSQLNRLEFVADYFNLAAQGFEFSPEITRRYLKYGGPKIGEKITKADMEWLEQLRKEICKKSLSDYGYALSM